MPTGAVRISFADADGDEHVEAILGRGDLLALGLGPWTFQVASDELLEQLLASMLQATSQRISALLGTVVTLRVRRPSGPAGLPELHWPSFIAEAVPLLGRLRFRLSPALIDRCEAEPMPRRSPSGMRQIPLMWDVRLACIGLQRSDCDGLTRGDVVRVLLSPVREVAGALVPHSGGATAAPRGTSQQPLRWVNVQVDPGGWISMKFERKDKQSEYAMNDDNNINGAIVPVSITLPVAAMSLHEIDSVKPGAVVDTGIRIQDVEVMLWTAGYRFATGRLVMIGEHIGVEIGRTERDLP